MPVWDAVETIRSAADSDTVWNLVLGEFAARGIERVIWIALASEDEAVRTNLDPVWTEAYRRDVLNGTDPFISHCLTQLRPIRTGSGFLHLHHKLTRQERAFVHQACETSGIRSGAALTVRSHVPRPAGGRTCASSTAAGWNLGTGLRAKAFDALFRVVGPEIALLAGCAGERLIAGAPPVARLTGRERDCLTLAALGCRNGEIADRLRLAEVTVELHLRHARQRLQARTRDQAVARALVLNAIQV